PYKSDLTRLAKALAAAGGPNPGTGGVVSDPNPIPPLLWLAIAVCEDAGLLENADGSLRPSADTQEFLAAPLENQIIAIFGSWTTCAFNDFAHIPTLTSYYEHAARDPWLSSVDDGPVPSVYRESMT